LGNRVDLNVDLIHRITGLSKTGKDSQTHISSKGKDSKLPAALVTNYKLQRGGRAYDLTAIADDTLRFTASLLAGRLLTKVRPKEVTESVIHLAIQVAEGEQFNWCLFLLNIFNQDCLTAQDEANHPFHFSWLLILCALVEWKEPPHTQFLQIRSDDCRGARYANLWDSNSPAKKKNNMIVFYEYYNLLKRTIQETPRISTEVVDVYDNRFDFMIDNHRISKAKKV